MRTMEVGSWCLLATFALISLCVTTDVVLAAPRNNRTQDKRNQEYLPKTSVTRMNQQLTVQSSGTFQELVLEYRMHCLANKGSAAYSVRVDGGAPRWLTISPVSGTIKCYTGESATILIKAAKDLSQKPGAFNFTLLFDGGASRYQEPLSVIVP